MDYCVFIDESGDHNLQGGGDPAYPIFVLVAVLFQQREYVQKAIPTFTEFKLRHFHHEYVILHERDIRKDLGLFSVLRNPQRKDSFLGEIGNILADLDFTVVAALIDKRRLVNQYHRPSNPYHIALEFVLERIYYHTRPQKKLPILIERRGKEEDKKLELTFRRICDGDRLHRGLSGQKLPYLEPTLVPKEANIIGLQIADLIARPIGLSYLRPDQPNRAYAIIKTKLRRSPKGEVEGWGLKVFP